MLIPGAKGFKIKCNNMRFKAHHASGPAVHHFCQAKLELANKLLSCLRYPTIPLQFSDTLGHRQHPIDSLKEDEKGEMWEQKR